MQKKILARQRPNEKGQTIIFVAISLISLLAMAALAIDIVTLYVARSEIQRAADATALAGAKAIADSGVTTLQISPPDPNLAAAQLLAQKMATAAVNAAVTANPPINLVAGGQPVLPGPALVDLAHQGNPRITVTLQANLPTFFSKIWGRGTTSVTATATAEAYNPAYLGATMTPIALTSVKPWLVANADPTVGAVTPPAFINPTTGVVEQGVIGKTFDLTADCNNGLPTCQLTRDPPTAINGPHPHVDYVPALVADNSKNVCPACAGGNDFEQSIACADVNAYAAVSCGSGATTVTWDNSVTPEGLTGHSADAAECLINAGAAGKLQGQDQLTTPPLPFSAPMQIQAPSGLVTTSNSIVTIPIIDNTISPFPAPGTALTVVGYMQAFINWVEDGTNGTNAGDINITVLNVAGCSTTNNGANPVVGGSGTSPVPVRLITAP
jgi:hypothetical protein